MILTSKTGLHYPDKMEQYKDLKLYLVVGARTAENGATIYTLKNEAGQYKDLSSEKLKQFFETKNQQAK